MMMQKQTFFFPAILVIAGLLVYFPVLSNDFLYFWDDQWVVMNVYTESGFTFSNLWAILTDFYHGQYAPFNELLYLTLYSLFGYNQVIFHAASLLLHLGNALLIYFCLIKLLAICSKTPAKTLQLVAFFTALFVVIHPFNAESVAWMSASKVLVYAFFYLLATYTFLLFLQTKKWVYYAATLLLSVFSFWGKEQAVTFPLWLLLIYWAAGGSFKDKKLWLVVVPFFVLATVGGLLTIFSQTGGSFSDNAPTYPLWQRVVYACYSLLEYMLKSFAPFKLSYLYPFPSLVGDPLPDWLLVYPLILVAFITTLWKVLSAHKALRFGLLFFGLHIAVALHLISLSRFAVVADRYAYLSTAGAGFIIAWYAVKFAQKYEKYKLLFFSLLVAFLFYMGIYANLRSHVWQDSETLKKELRETIERRNDSRWQCFTKYVNLAKLI